MDSHTNSLYNTLHKLVYVIYKKPVLSDFEAFWIEFCINSFFIFCSGLLIVTFYALYGVRMTSSSHDDIESFSDFYDCLSDIDDECGGVDDVIHYASIFCLMAAWYFLFTFFFMFFYETMVWVFIMFILTLTFILLLPITVLYSFGFPFLILLRGISRTTFALGEFIYDLLALLSMVARYVVQHVRLIVIMLAYLDFFELVYYNFNLTGDNFLVQLFSFNSSNSYFFLNNYWYDWFSDLCMSHLFLVYYCGHLSYSFGNQLLTFLGLTIIVFFFLYAYVDDIIYEHYFKLKLAR